MFKDITVKNIDDKLFTVKYVENYPDTCPICHKGIAPKNHFTILCGRVRDLHSYLQFIFQCPYRNCQRLFIGIYRCKGYGSSEINNYYELYSVAPIAHKEEQFSEETKSVSSSFVNIYNQSIFAENEGWNELIGVGLRKALEFLIKDYLIAKHKQKEKEIKKTLLGACIKNYIDDTKIKECAKRAVWLGNDETHYVRKWQDKDIEDLKTLIKLTVNWIESELLTQQYTSDMPED